MDTRDSSLTPLVARKLDAYPGEFMLFAQYQRLPAARPSFAEYKATAIREMSERFASKAEALRTPPDPALISIKSWQFGFTEAGDEAQAARGFADGLYLRLQSYLGDHLDSDCWRACLAAFEHPERWLARGREAEAEGWTVEANACFAAARWLDPSCAPEIAELRARRSDELPERLLRQPDLSFAEQPWPQRHWLAWDMKNYGRLDLPTLLRWSCDPNFSVRTRIYRSLGQRPHPAAIQALQEGTTDPHPFARAQALRSLGWCADPSFIEVIDTLAREDPDPEARRSAAKASQRIRGFWRYYGQWNEIVATPARARAVAQELIDAGFEGFAYDLLVAYVELHMDEEELDALLDSIEDRAFEREQPEDWGKDPASYSYWFEEARRDEAERAASSAKLDPEAARAKAHEPGAVGFEARRVLRWLELGSLDERRARAPARVLPPG